MVSDVGGHVPDPPVELPHGPTEPYAEGQRDTANCRHCGQPIWIVYHGPRENHTIEGRARAQVCQEIAEALAEAGKSRGGAYWQPGEPAEFVERFALADRLSDTDPEPCAECRGTGRKPLGGDYIDYEAGESARAPCPSCSVPSGNEEKR